MANVSRYDQYNLDNVFDDFFKGFLVRPMGYENGRYQSAAKAADIKMDVTENPQAYIVKAEIPGVSKEDIQVSIDGNTVSLSAEIKRETEQKEGDKVIHTERYYGRVARSFSLSTEIDDTQAQAKYNNGVLELTLPKKAAATAKTLTIQ